MDFVEYQQRAKTTAVYPEHLERLYPALGLGGEVGEVLNKLKKVERDDGGAVSDAVRVALKKELGDVLWYLAQLATDLELDLGEIAEENICRLADRKERGVIHGSGDNR